MRIHAASIIYDKNKKLKFNFFAEECFKLCSYEKIQTGLKVGLKNKKIQNFYKLNRRHYHLQKRGSSIH